MDSFPEGSIFFVCHLCCCRSTLNSTIWIGTVRSKKSENSLKILGGLKLECLVIRFPYIEKYIVLLKMLDPTKNHEFHPNFNGKILPFGHALEETKLESFQDSSRIDKSTCQDIAKKWLSTTYLARLGRATPSPDKPSIHLDDIRSTHSGLCFLQQRSMSRLSLH